MALLQNLVNIARCLAGCLGALSGSVKGSDRYDGSGRNSGQGLNPIVWGGWHSFREPGAPGCPGQGVGIRGRGPDFLALSPFLELISLFIGEAEVQEEEEATATTQLRIAFLAGRTPLLLYPQIRHHHFASEVPTPTIRNGCAS